MRDAHLRLACRLLLATVCASGTSLSHAEEPSTRVHAFEALLDGHRIGEHRFTVVADGRGRRVTSEADFVVRVLGFEAYRYRHRTQEQWSGDCLAGLTSTTDDDGKKATVTLTRAGEANDITTGTASTSVPGCLMSYAYWNPALLRQTRLLNPQTGHVDAVQVEHVGARRLPVHGQVVSAEVWRITGGEAPVDVLLSPTGEWVGLDSLVAKGKHRLSYRLP